MPFRYWLFWEGDMPEYIRLCIKTIMTHNENVVLLDRKSFDLLFKYDKDINIDALGWVHASDFIRAYLLKHYGGLYMDVDCIVFQNLIKIEQLTEQFDFIGYRDPCGYMCCNLMAAQVGSIIIDTFYNQICGIIRGKQPIEWLGIGSIPMDEVISKFPGKSYLLPTNTIMPLRWDESEKLSLQRSDEEHRQFFDEEAMCYMLANDTIKSREETKIFYSLNKNEILNGQYFLSYLFRRSLNINNQNV